MTFTKKPTSSGTTDNSDASNASETNSEGSGMPSSSSLLFENFDAFSFNPSTSLGFEDFDMSLFPYDDASMQDQTFATSNPDNNGFQQHQQPPPHPYYTSTIYPTPSFFQPDAPHIPPPSLSATQDLHAAMYPTYAQAMQLAPPALPQTRAPESSSWRPFPPQFYPSPPQTSASAIPSVPLPATATNAMAMDISPRLNPAPTPSLSSAAHSPMQVDEQIRIPVVPAIASSSRTSSLAIRRPRTRARDHAHQPIAGPGPRTQASRRSARASGDGYDSRGAICDECGQQIAHAKDMARHKKTHLPSEQKKKQCHQCDYCEHATLQAANLHRHIEAVHLRQKNYICTVPGCTARFGDPSGLNKHQKHKHAFGSKRKQMGMGMGAAVTSVNQTEFEKAWAKMAAEAREVGKAATGKAGEAGEAISGRKKAERRERREVKERVKGVRKDNVRVEGGGWESFAGFRLPTPPGSPEPQPQVAAPSPSSATTTSAAAETTQEQLDAILKAMGLCLPTEQPEFVPESWDVAVSAPAPASAHEPALSPASEVAPAELPAESDNLPVTHEVAAPGSTVQLTTVQTNENESTTATLPPPTPTPTPVVSLLTPPASPVLPPRQITTTSSTSSTSTSRAPTTSTGPIRTARRRARETREDRHVRELEERVGMRAVRRGSGAGFGYGSSSGTVTLGFLRGQNLHHSVQARNGSGFREREQENARRRRRGDKLEGGDGAVTVVVGERQQETPQPSPTRAGFSNITNANATRDYYPNARYTAARQTSAASSSDDADHHRQVPPVQYAAFTATPTSFTSTSPALALALDSALSASLSQLHLQFPSPESHASASASELDLQGMLAQSHLYFPAMTPGGAFALGLSAVSGVMDGDGVGDMDMDSPAKRVEAARRKGMYGGAFPLGDSSEVKEN